MKKSLILLISLPILLFSQEKNKKGDSDSGTTNWNEIKGQILGTVKTDTDNQVLEYATVSLKNTKTDKLIEGTITDKKGKFLFENIAIGEYKLTISFIGYENRVINITTTKSKPNYSDNNILISVNTKLLSEVTIEERKAIYETKIDKIVYNAENDLNDSENDATDVLRKAPLLSVDLDGNVTLRGSKNIKFLVNGKASSFFATDVATALQMIPADQIKTIEVITSPGAKYDGEGDAGIVNIITKKAIIDGYNATFNTMTGTKVTRSNFNLNIGKGKFGLSARDGNETLVTNQIKFTVKLFGATIFDIEGYGEEKYIDDQLISFSSKTLQNDKEKFVNLKLNRKTNKFDILGSSYNGEASLNNIVGNWWSHNILTTDSQISPISGSVKEQVVTFIRKEKIDLYGKTYDTERFKLNSKDMSLPKDKRLEFEIWYDKENNIIRKVTYSRMGNWEYRVKNIE